MAILTYIPAGILGIGWVFFETTEGLIAIFALLAAAASVVTVFCTAMIYAQLKTIRQWHNPRVVTVYLIFALMSGWLWCHALFQLFGVFAPGAGLWAAGLIVLAWGEKLFYWRAIDREAPAGSVASATGLAALGKVRLLDLPHSEENFLMKEMGYRIGRKHAGKLRRLAVLLGGLLPLALVLVGFAADGAVAAVTAVLAAALAMVGIFIERWLFFAEATHKVTLYYGAESA
jgi:DMSO reductase anchor subunit